MTCWPFASTQQRLIFMQRNTDLNVRQTVKEGELDPDDLLAFASTQQRLTFMQRNTYLM
jgi:hypothetical protein